MVIITVEKTCRLSRQVEVDEDEYEAMLASAENGDIFPDEDDCPEVTSAFEDADFGDTSYKVDVADADNADKPVASWASSPGYTVKMPVCLGDTLYGTVDGSLIEATVIGILYRTAEDQLGPELVLSLSYEDDDGAHSVISASGLDSDWFYTAEEAKTHLA